MEEGKRMGQRSANWRGNTEILLEHSKVSSRTYVKQRPSSIPDGERHPSRKEVRCTIIDTYVLTWLGRQIPIYLTLPRVVAVVDGL